MTEHRKLDSPQVQVELLSKLQQLFARENFEKDAYFIARMNTKMEIPLQAVYQQRDIYRICPNGRYVLQALKNCQNVIVNQEHLYVVPRIIPRALQLYVRISFQKQTPLSDLITHIKQNSGIEIIESENISLTSTLLTLATQENAIALNDWILSNKLRNEPIEVVLKEEDLYKVFRANVQQELNQYYEKFALPQNKQNKDKKTVEIEEMYENFSFYQHQQNVQISNPNRVGENVFSNPFNYFFYQQPVQEQIMKPFIHKNSGDSFGNNELNQMNPLTMLMMQQQMIQGANFYQNNNNNTAMNNSNQGNSQRRRNHHQKRGDNNNNSQNAETNRSKSGGNNLSKRSDQNYKRRSKNQNRNPYQKEAGDKDSKKTRKTTKPILDNEDHFPSLGKEQVAKVKTEKKVTIVEGEKQDKTQPIKENVEENNRQSRKISQDKRVSESYDRERNVSESKDRQQFEKKKERSPSKNLKSEEIIYYKKGKDIKITFEKNELLNIFLTIKQTITPPASILESSKDDFITVINISAPLEIELTKPTDVDLKPLSNPGTPYQGSATVPFRKASITRSNIKRKESEKIPEVDEIEAVKNPLNK